MLCKTGVTWWRWQPNVKNKDASRGETASCEEAPAYVPDSVVPFVGREPRRNPHCTAHRHRSTHTHIFHLTVQIHQGLASSACCPSQRAPLANYAYPPLTLVSGIVLVWIQLYGEHAHQLWQSRVLGELVSQHPTAPGSLSESVDGSWTLFSLCSLQVKYFVATIVFDLREDREFASGV